MFDPASVAPSGFGTSGVPAEQLARFAAVLGMAQSEADRRPPIVDFLNVRRKAEPRQIGREHVILAAVAAGVLLMIAGFLWYKHHSLSSQLVAIRKQITEMDKESKTLQPVVDQVATITQWRSTDVNWLDELVEVSTHMRPTMMPRTVTDLGQTGYPERLDVLVKQQMVMTRPPGRNSSGGVINITQAIAKDQDAAKYLENRFYEDPRGLVVTSPAGQGDSSIPGYTWKVDYTIAVPPPDDADEPADVIEPGEKAPAKTPVAEPAAKPAAEPAKDNVRADAAKSATEPSAENKEDKEAANTKSTAAEKGAPAGSAAKEEAKQ